MKVRFKHPWFKIFPGGGAVFSDYVLFKRKPDEVSQRLFRHELEHVYQIEREGAAKFYARYIWRTLRYGYKRNPYERQARAAEDLPLTEKERAIWDAAVERYNKQVTENI